MSKIKSIFDKLTNSIKTMVSKVVKKNNRR